VAALDRSPCGVLLAGGASTRFNGEPKGLAPFGGRRLADFALASLTASSDEVMVACNDPRAARWFPAHQIVADSVRGLGALGALRTALQAANGRDVVVCAWDMPMVGSALLRRVAAVVRDGAMCCVPMHGDQLEPLCAAYSARCLPIIEQMLERGDRAARDLLKVAGGQALKFGPEADADLLVRRFFNVNTPDDLVMAQRLLTNPHTVS
jgi:molybdenum cofactor guanylyltransferase